jgi:hypothetical protein
MRHNKVPPGSDTCTQVFCSDAAHNSVPGYENCPVLPQAVFTEMAAKELLAENVIQVLSGH